MIYRETCSCRCVNLGIVHDLSFELRMCEKATMRKLRVSEGGREERNKGDRQRGRGVEVRKP